jgi:hypothetical protein
MDSPAPHKTAATSLKLPPAARPAGSSPRRDAASPRSDARSPRPFARSPRAEAASPRSNSRSPPASRRSPQPNAASPRADAKSPRADAASPRAAGGKFQAAKLKIQTKFNDPRSRGVPPPSVCICVHLWLISSSASASPFPCFSALGICLIVAAARFAGRSLRRLLLACGEVASTRHTGETPVLREILPSRLAASFHPPSSIFHPRINSLLPRFRPHLTPSTPSDSIF